MKYITCSFCDKHIPIDYGELIYRVPGDPFHCCSKKCLSKCLITTKVEVLTTKLCKQFSYTIFDENGIPNVID